MKPNWLSLVVVGLLGLVAVPAWGAPVIPEDAIKKDDAVAVAQAIRAGAAVNAAYGNGIYPTALMKAADANAGAVAKVLIANKAEVNRTNKWGATALMQAAAKNATNVLALLLQHRAEV